MRKRVVFAAAFSVAIIAAFAIRGCIIHSDSSSETGRIQSYSRERIHCDSVIDEGVSDSASKSRPENEAISSVLALESIQRARQHGALASVVVEAVDENGNPVADADVDVYFYVLDKQPNKRTGKTDSSGRFTAAANATWEVRCFVRKDGFYEGIGRHYLQHNLTAKSVVNGRWQPWNSLVRVVLLRKGQPAEFVRKFESPLVLPSGDTPYGYDFDIGELVAPFGKGQTPHVFFQLLSPHAEMTIDDELVISFPGTNTGLIAARRNQESEAEFPTTAPFVGYVGQTNLTSASIRPRSYHDSNDAPNRFFVVKTQEHIGDSKNSQVRYGFMHVISFNPEKKTIRFWYGISKEPDNPNLEGFGW